MFSAEESSGEAMGNRGVNFATWAMAQQQQNVNVDWAKIAQQWIQMQQRESSVGQSMTDNVPAAPPPPRISMIDYEEEKGEAPMEVVKDDDLLNGQDSFTQPSAAAEVYSSRNQPADWQPAYFTDHWRQNWNSWVPTSNPAPRLPQTIHAIQPEPYKEPKQAPQQAPASTTSTDTVNAIDAAKRKTLPAWIREGLEKMEKEKLKQLKKETTEESASSNKLGNPSTEIDKQSLLRNSKFMYGEESEESEYEAIPEETIKIDDSRHVKEEPPEPLVTKSREELFDEWMLIVRRSLTEILLEVTNEEIQSIAQDTLRKSKAKASSAQVFRKSAISSITGKLGLGAYADSDTDITDTDEDNSIDGEDVCDSEDEIKENIRKLQNAFKTIAQDIELRVSEAEQKEQKRMTERTTASSSSSATAPTALKEPNETPSKKSSYDNDKESGETQPDKKIHFNGRHTRERTSRFSDAKMKPYSINTQTILPNPSSSTDYDKRKSSYSSSAATSSSTPATGSTANSSTTAGSSSKRVSHYSSESSSDSYSSYRKVSSTSSRHSRERSQKSSSSSNRRDRGRSERSRRSSSDSDGYSRSSKSSRRSKRSRDRDRDRERDKNRSRSRSRSRSHSSRYDQRY